MSISRQAIFEGRAMNQSLTSILGDFAASLQLRDVPEKVIDRAKASLLHNLGCALLVRGSEKWPRSLVSQHYAQPAECSLLLPGGGKAAMDGAVVANAAVLHAGSQDDIHVPSTSHPGVVIMPPALAVAEIRNATGRDLLRALIIGYEVHGRIGRRHNELVTRRGYRSSCMCGVFGSAVAASLLYGHDARQIAAAIGLASNLAGGLGQTFQEGTTEWLWQLSSTARSGLFAARSAGAGVTAAPHSLEGERGFFRAYAGTNEFAAGVTDGLGETWVISEVELKDYPVCGILQRPVEMMIKAVTENQIDTRDIVRVELSLCPYEATYPGTDYSGPFETMTAPTMSAHFCLSLAAVAQRVTLADVFRFDDPQVLTGVGRVKVVNDEQLASHASRLRVVLRSGSEVTLSDSGAAPTPTVKSVAGRLMNATPVSDQPLMQRLIAAVVGIDQGGNAAECFEAFQHGSTV